MHSTASDTLNAYANLLLFALLVDKIITYAAIQYAIHPHPTLSSHRSKGQHTEKWHPSPLHHLIHVYDITPSKVEKVDSHRKHPHPTWTPPILTSILKNKTTAAEQVKKCQNKFRIFTDQSITDGGIGAAAVIKRKLMRMQRYEVYKSIRFHLRLRLVIGSHEITNPPLPFCKLNADWCSTLHDWRIANHWSPGQGTPCATHWGLGTGNHGFANPPPQICQLGIGKLTIFNTPCHIDLSTQQLSYMGWVY